jgi:hypothetical protein
VGLWGNVKLVCIVAGGRVLRGQCLLVPHVSTTFLADGLQAISQKSFLGGGDRH